MGKEYLIDTNVLIDFQTQVLPESGLYYLSKIIDRSFIISFISYIEVLGYNKVTPSMQEFIALANVFEINKAIIDQTVLIRKSRRIKLSDSIIAATSITRNLILISHNTKDFHNIRGLHVIDLYNI